MYTIRTTKREYEKYNNMQCYIVNLDRDDGLIEVYVIKYHELILLRPDELEENQQL